MLIAMLRFAISAIVCLLAPAAQADPAEVVEVALRSDGPGWRVDVTLRHGDTGWDDYADGWRIETPAGEVLGTRVLHHPHVEEQPFTRSLGGVEIGPEVTEIVVRTRTNVTGWADEVGAPIAVPGRG
jgi:hypothetical protein